MFFDIGMFAEGEVRWRHATSICGFLESELRFGHLGLEVFVKFPQVDGIFSSVVGGQILLGVNREIQVVSFVSEERGPTGSLARRIQPEEAARTSCLAGSCSRCRGIV